jgi:rubredoxin
LPGDGSLHLQFTLPDLGLIYTRAKPRHAAGNESGLAFESLPDASRTAIAEFVTKSLTQSL